MRRAARARRFLHRAGMVAPGLQRAPAGGSQGSIMIRLTCLLTTGLIVLHTVGCDSSPLMSTTYSAEEYVALLQPDTEARSLATDATPVTINFAEPLRLDDAVAHALQHHPELAAFSSARRAREAEVIQASRRPNPEIEFGLEEFAGSGPKSEFEAAEWSLRIVQLFERGDKRQRRVDLAERTVEEAELEYQAARLAVATAVVRSFVEVLTADATLAQARAHLTFVEQFQQVVDRRIQAGAASPVERNRAAVEAAERRAEVEAAVEQGAVARRRLALSMGLYEHDLEAVSGELAPPVEPIDRMEIARLVRETPELERWAREIARRRAAVELARAGAVPDFQAGVGLHFFQESDDIAFSIGVAMPLMIFDQREGEIAARGWEVRSAQDRRRAAELTMLANATRLHGEARLAWIRARAIEQDVLPAAERVVQDLRAAFEEGKIGLLDALDAQRRLFEFRRDLVEMRATYHTAMAELDGLIGRLPLDQNLQETVSSNGESE